MQKCFIDIEQRFSKAKLASLFLSVLILAIIAAPLAMAASPSIATDPSQGPVGTMVMVYIRGFPALDSVNITFGATKVVSATTDKWALLNVLIKVPQLSPGTYDITATGSTVVATNKFIVTQASSPTHISTPKGTTTGSIPTHSPETASAGFWSPLTIAIVSVVIACAIFMTAIYISRSKQKTSQYQVAPYYEPQLSVPPKRPNAPSKISQPANYSQQPPFTKICRHCKRTVRDDLNVCPYCFKRLR